MGMITWACARVGLAPTQAVIFWPFRPGDVFGKSEGMEKRVAVGSAVAQKVWRGKPPGSGDEGPLARNARVAGSSVDRTRSF